MGSEFFGGEDLGFVCFGFFCCFIYGFVSNVILYFCYMWVLAIYSNGPISFSRAENQGFCSWDVSIFS